MEPLMDPDPKGGQVVITRFECKNVISIVRLLVLHKRIKRQVRRAANGFVGAAMLISWRRRTVLSVSVWERLEDIYSMGNVSRHIQAAKNKPKLGIATTAGIFSYVGDWRYVMFHGNAPNNTPLLPIIDR